MMNANKDINLGNPYEIYLALEEPLKKKAEAVKDLEEIEQLQNIAKLKEEASTNCN